MWQETLRESLPWSGARLRFRELTPEDAAFVRGMLSSPDVMRFLGGPLSNSEDFVRDSIVKRRGLTESLYIIETNTECSPVGYAAIVENPSIGLNEFDFLIAFLPEHQGNRYGPEALRILRDRWMRATGCSHCTASVRPENERSVKILVECAFQRVGEYADGGGFTRHIYRYEDKPAA